MNPITLNDKTIGHVWQEGDEWHSEHSGSGMSWAAETRQAAVSIVVDYEVDK